MDHLDEEAGDGGDKEQDADSPVEGEEKPNHGDEGDPVLQGLRQTVDDPGRPVRSFPLGAVQCVIIFGVLVVGEIEIDGFLVNPGGHIIGDHGALRLRHISADKPDGGLDHGNETCGDNEIHCLPEAFGGVARLDGMGDGVDQKFQNIKGEEGDDALDQGEEDRQYGPVAARFPDQEEGPVDAQGVLDFGGNRRWWGHG